MNWTRVSKDDFSGSFWLLNQHEGTEDSFERYYGTIDCIRPLLCRFDKPDSVMTGYYVSHVGKNRKNPWLPEKHCARLAYFTKDEDAGRTEIPQFAKDTDLQCEEYGPPTVDDITDPKYRGDEQEFRDFLVTYTRIGMDLLATDPLLCVQCLFATAQRPVCKSPNNLVERYRSHLEPSFEAMSPFWRTRCDGDRQEFWKSLSVHLTRTSWAHMFVDMILGFKWGRRDTVSTVESINKDLQTKGAKFEIPPNWSPHLE